MRPSSKERHKDKKSLQIGRINGNKKVLQELETEFDNLMRSGLDELAVEDIELAEENFSLAATVLDRVKELSLPMAVALENKYLVNPYDYQ